jgi:hypothetical protein
VSVETLLSRLQRVRKTGQGRWLACCPAHDDGSPSLSVRELPDGRVLVHDFAGCALDQIIGAIGIGLDELAPQALTAAWLADKESRTDRHERSRESRPWSPGDVLAATADEALYAAVAASDVAEGLPLTPERRQRLWVAAGRLAAAAGWTNGR